MAYGSRRTPSGDTRTVTPSRRIDRANWAARSSQKPGRSNPSSRSNRSPDTVTDENRSIRYTRKSSPTRAQTYQTPAFRTSPYGASSRSTSAPELPRR